MKNAPILINVYTIQASKALYEHDKQFMINMQFL
jgi:hypothetical protein